MQWRLWLSVVVVARDEMAESDAGVDQSSKEAKKTAHGLLKFTYDCICSIRTRMHYLASL
jgi:hypothetical protein